MYKLKKLILQTGLLDLVDAFERDADGVLAQVYTLYRQEYLIYSRSISENETLCVDSFQEAVIGLYENLKRDKIKEEKSTVKTYLFSIGKHKLLNAIKKEMKHVYSEIDKESFINVEDQKDSGRLKEMISEKFDKLGQRCQDVLLRFYYHRYSINAIMLDMKFKNENTVKAHKSRCLAKLREAFNNDK